MAYKRISPTPVNEGGTGQVTLTSNGVLVGNGTTGVQATAAGATGEGLMGNTGSAPTYTASPSFGGSVTAATGLTATAGGITATGNSSINISGTGTTDIGTGTNSGALSLGNTNSGAVTIDCGTAGITVGATANAHSSTFGSTNSTSATTVQSGSGALNVTSTNGALTINSGTGTLGVSTDASATTVNIGTGAAAKAVTVGSTNTTSGLTLNSGSNGIKAIGVASVAVANKNYVTINTSTGALGSDSGPASSISITGNTGGALTGNAFTFTGGTTGLTFAGATSTETLGGTLVVANGGTGIATATAYSVICAGTTATGAFQNVSGLGTSGQVLTSNGAGALPSWQAASGGGITWTVITADQTAAVNNGYICNKGSALVLTLPTTAAAGTVIRVTGINTALGWKIAQNAGQTIYFGTVNTTTGTGGYLQSSATRDSVELVCVVADTSWNVISSVGNITYV